MTIFENFMKQARADLAVQYRREDIATDQDRLNKENKVYLFWKNFEMGVRRLLPAAIVDFIPAINPIVPPEKYPVIALHLPHCLEIKVAFRTYDNGQPLFRNDNPYLVPGIATHLGKGEVIWNDELGAQCQPLWMGSLTIAAAMAEERWLSLDYASDKPELRYEADAEQIDFIEDFDD